MAFEPGLIKDLGMNLHGQRFGGVARLYGQSGLQRLRRAHVCVVGLGGVGSWAVEALARCGIGEMTLVDVDNVCMSNVNRQLPALEANLGRGKAEVMAERVREINPECRVHPVQTFINETNVGGVLGGTFDFVVDAIDSVSSKALLIASCRERGKRVVVTGGAGGRTDPTQIEVADLATSSHCGLLQEVRRTLRRAHGFSRGDAPFGIECVFSRETCALIGSEEGECGEGAGAKGGGARAGRKKGYGTVSFVTGAFGLVAASRVVRAIAGTGGAGWGGAV